VTVLASPTQVVHPARNAGGRPLTAKDLWAIPRVGNPAPAPGGTWLVVPVTTYSLEQNEGRTRLWLVATSGGEPRALTAADVSSTEPAISPDGKRLAFVRKRDPKEKGQLHVMPLDGGEPEKLTDLPLGVLNPRWFPDGKRIAFLAPLVMGVLTPEATRTRLEEREKDKVKAHVTEDRLFRHWDTWLTTGEVPHLFVLDLETRALTDLIPDSTRWFDFMEPSGEFDISPDGEEIAFAANSSQPPHSFVRWAIYTVPTRGGEVRCLTPDHPADDHRPRYSADGASLVYGMQVEPFFYADRVRLVRYDRKSGTHVVLTEAWDRSAMGWEPGADGTIVFAAEDVGRQRLFSLPPSGGTPRRLTDAGSASGVQVAKDGHVFFNLHSASAPAEIASCAADGSGMRTLTRFTAPALEGVALGEVREMEFEGADGDRVQMYVVLPPGFDPKKKWPLVHVIHGGPHAQSADQFFYRWNTHVFAGAGYVVACVNFHGSTSWGQAFAQSIQGSWGRQPLEDVLKATDVLVATGWVDESRMAATGGSYGGYMAAWIGSQTRRFKCIINHAGVYNTLSQYASDVTQGRHKSFGGEPWDGLENINRWNPAQFAAGQGTPTLVIHGERDYRVPVGQGLEAYAVLKAKGVPARLVYFPDENHWILKPQNSILWYREFLGWLQRWLGA
jgi:dipeptidyl aminopeptidase/acylaminoacyl peptidase